jgi:hypothetical protein
MLAIKHITLIFIIFVMFSSTALAGFAKHEIITKNTMAKHGINVMVTAINENNLKYTIKAPMVDNETPAWLITCKAPVTEKDQDFRNYIWIGKRDQNDIIKKIRLIPNDKKVLEFTLAKQNAQQTYLYIDYAKPLLDGGYYYTINLTP